MSDKINYSEIGWAEMHPDLYDGESCDQVKPQWNSSMEGDKNSEEGIEVIDYPALAYPPGTKITISIPCCPKCGNPADSNSIMPGERYEISDCDCGFNWNNWTDEQYS